MLRFAQMLLLGALLFVPFARPLTAQVVYADDKGVAIKGYDVVAYFTDGKPLQGKSEFAHKWMDAEWYFTNAEHRDLFKNAPEKYAPQYGGFCAYGVCVKNAKFPTDPAAWKIVEGRLYLNYNKPTQEAWTKDPLAQTITKGDMNWKTLRSTNTGKK